MALCGPLLNESVAFQPSLLLNDSSQLRAEIHALLRSNTLPEDTACFRRVIHEAPSELARYDTEIDRVKSILDGLTSDRATLAACADTCRSVFAPVRRLPSELLVEIFEACAPLSAVEVNDTDTAAEELDRLNMRYLLQLSQVCSYWRVIAMRTTRLWSWVTADTTLWTDSILSQTGYLDRLETCLERGGTHPLTLNVIVKIDHPDERQILEALVKQAPRWRDIYLCCQLESFASVITDNNNENGEQLPLLERLHICAHGQSGIDINFFEGASRLKDVVFDGRVSGIPSLPWSQLQYFRYRDDLGGPKDVFVALSLLGRLPAGTKFSLSLNIADTELTDLPPIVSDVSDFGLGLMVNTDGDQATEALGKVLKALTLPHLKVIDFERDWYKPAPHWNNIEFLAFASRSSFHTNLTELGIHIVISDEELLQCLAALPLLTDLGISDCSGRKQNILITDNLLRRLTWSADSNEGCLVPKLHYIFLTSLFKFSDDAFLDFVLSRLAPGRTNATDKRPEPFQARGLVV
ncbi:3-beta hydroxysteroid dehydrogenase isomerase family [Mycena venus]|uniref:3-beta hydroxysteroid dehydrogenase isomerase family n=1 Tax=Mycena venus TaxID=2733690 RepID=A0A8H6YP77_9AGAR|nr:3-beta hydroxysteroid dehydrogenase isomerase family [Mycena venus]